MYPKKTHPSQKSRALQQNLGFGIYMRYRRHTLLSNLGFILILIWTLSMNGSKVTASEGPESMASALTDTNPATPQKFHVREIKVLDSTVFSQKELDAVVQPFVGRELTIEEIRQAADAVTQLYLNKNYLNSRAIPVAPQGENPDGVVVIRVIEGRLKEIQIEGTQRLDPGYIRSRIELGASVPLNALKLEKQLRLLRLDPLFQYVEASLRPTGNVGQSILVVRVKEANSLTSALSVDNYSPPSVGAERLGTQLGIRNLTGIGDELTGSYYHTLDGGSDSFDFSYQIPVNAMDGKVQIRYAPTRSQITESPYNQFGIRANQDVYSINYRQPLIKTPSQEFALSLGFTYEDGQTFLFDSPYSFGIGPDQNGVSRTSVFNFTQDYTKRSPQGAWQLRSQFNVGVGLFNATINTAPVPDGRFFSWLGQVERTQILNQDQMLIVHGDLQLTPDSLLPSQQFVIGGDQSVRGYSQNIRSGDNGFRFSVEDQITVQRNEAGLPIVKLAPFIDLGDVWNQASNPNQLPSQTFLIGAGLGLLWNQALGIDHLSMRLDYGIPFINLQDRGNNLEDDGIYFSVRYQN